MQIEVTTSDRTAEFDLFETTSIKQGTAIDLGSGITVGLRGSLVRKGGDFPNVFSLVVSFGGSVASSLVANVIWEWLMRGLKQRPKSISIDRTTVEFEEDAVKRVITEKLEANE